MCLFVYHRKTTGNHRYVIWRAVTQYSQTKRERYIVATPIPPHHRRSTFRSCRANTRRRTNSATTSDLTTVDCCLSRLCDLCTGTFLLDQLNDSPSSSSDKIIAKVILSAYRADILVSLFRAQVLKQQCDARAIDGHAS